MLSLFGEKQYQSVAPKQELEREILFCAKRGENFKILNFYFAVEISSMHVHM